MEPDLEWQNVVGKCFRVLSRTFASAETIPFLLTDVFFFLVAGLDDGKSVLEAISFSSLLSYHFSSFSHILIALSRLWLIISAIPRLCYSILTRLCLSISGKLSLTHYTLFTVSTDIPMIFNLLLFLVLTQNSLEKNVLPITPFSLAITYSFNSIAVSFNQFGLNAGVPRLYTQLNRAIIFSH